LEFFVYEWFNHQSLNLFREFDSLFIYDMFITVAALIFTLYS